MAGTVIKNVYDAALSLPFPFAGVLGPGKSCIVSLTVAQCQTILGTIANGVRFTVLPDNYTGPYDTAFDNGAGAGDAYINAGGVRQMVGPFAIGLTSGKTAARMSYGLATIGGSFVAPRAGHILALVAMVDSAPSGSTVVLHVYKNGVDTGVSATIAAGATQTSITQAKKITTFAVGDQLDLRYDTGAGLGNTPNLWASLEISQ